MAVPFLVVAAVVVLASIVAWRLLSSAWLEVQRPPGGDLPGK